MAQGLIEREATRAGRGRPSHRYSLTEKGYRHAGTNFGDLAIALWNEVRAVRDPEIRKGLLQRIARGMAGMYGDSISGESTAERMQSVADVFSNRDVPFVVEQSGELPVLTALACPYPELAEQDRGICAMERLLFSELVGRNVRLTDCRLEGDTCCRFQPAEAVASG
jgi:predicted ArsR family transcriptional regulator